jgi:hypothetical protein
MKTRETTTPVRAFDRAYINGQFVTPHGTQVVDLVNPTDNKVIGKVTARDFDRDLPADVLLDPREREVDAGGDAGGSPHAAVAHEDRIRLHGHGRVAAAKSH